MLVSQRTVISARVLVILALLLTGWGCGGESGQTVADQEAVGSAVAQEVRSEPAAMADEAGSAGAAEGSSAMTEASAVDARRLDVSEHSVAGQRIFPEDVARVLAEAPKYPLPELPAPEDRDESPDLELVDLSGRELQLRDLRGQVVLLAFWATWCRPCIMEIPHLVHLTETYEKAGFKVLGLSVDRTGLAAVKPFIDRRPEINYPIVPNGTSAAMKFGGIRSIPTSYLLDRQGRVIRAFVGLQPPEILEGHIQAALRETI